MYHVPISIICMVAWHASSVNSKLVVTQGNDRLSAAQHYEIHCHSLFRDVVFSEFFVLGHQHIARLTLFTNFGQ